MQTKTKQINDAGLNPRTAQRYQELAGQRDDTELEVWTAEIRLRASMRIGELVRELDSHQGERTDLFRCHCGERFDLEVWHCSICGHHCPTDKEECSNCHQGERTDKELVAAGRKKLDAIEHAGLASVSW